MAEPIGLCWSNLPWHLTKATYEGSGAHCAWLCIILFFLNQIMTVYMYFFGCLLGQGVIYYSLVGQMHVCLGFWQKPSI